MIYIYICMYVCMYVYIYIYIEIQHNIPIRVLCWGLALSAAFSCRAP